MGALAVGDAAVAIYDGSTLVAAVIQAQSPHHAIAAVEGQVTGVTASMLTVTPQQGAAVTVTVGATAQVFLNGAVSKLSAIATGDSARVIYDATTLAAALVQAQSPHQQTAVVAGAVTGVTASTLTITPQQGAAVTVTVGATTQVFLDGAPATSAALATGDEARAAYDATTLAASLVQAISPSHTLAVVQGKVTAVSAGSLTITPQQGAAVTLTAGDATQVFLDGAVSTLSAIDTGDEARAIFDSATLVASVVEAQSPQAQLAVVAGQVTAVGATSITITPQQGAAVTLTVDASTRILLDGAVATLASIPTGAAAQALYDSSTLVAAVIQAQSPHQRLEQVEGSVTAIGSGSITITPPHGAAVTLGVTAATQVFLDGRAAPLSAIATGDMAGALYGGTDARRRGDRRPLDALSAARRRRAAAGLAGRRRGARLCRRRPVAAGPADQQVVSSRLCWWRGEAAGRRPPPPTIGGLDEGSFHIRLASCRAPQFVIW